MKSSAHKALPRNARHALRKLGSDIRIARKKRRLSTISLAERAFISRSTLYRLETGDPAVSIGIYATVLSILGLVDRLADLADRREDLLGLDLEEDRLPKTVHKKRRKS